MSNNALYKRRCARRAQRGALRGGVLVLLLLLVCLALIGLLVRAARNEAPREAVPEPTSRASDRAAGTPSESPMSSIDSHSARGVDAASVAPRDQSAPEVSAAKFDGRGVIRGHIEARDGGAFPEVWTLIVEPSPMLTGRERAVRREVHFTHGERTFTIDDLPFAGYRVRAEALGLNNHPADVLLVKGSAQQFVDIAFLPSGFIEGVLLEHSGSPAEGVRVTLAATEDADHEFVPRATATDAAGRYLFENVLDGDYHLLFGGPESPLVPPDFLSFHAPSLQFPDRTLPASCDVNLVTLDESGRPLGDVRVSVFAHGGTSLDVQSDASGKLAIRRLLPGNYRFTARAADGRQGALAVILNADKTWDVEIRLSK